MKLSAFRLAMPLLCISWLLSVFAVAQVSASLSGTITDATGRAVAAATVTVTDVEFEAARTTLTDQTGHYEFSALPVGRYAVRVTKDGFAEQVRTGVLLVVGQD